MPARGSHLCALSSTPSEQFDLAAAFLREGLARGERCVFLAHETDRRSVARALTARGVPLRPERRIGVELEDCEAAGFAKLPFSSSALIGRWAKAADAAVAEGHAGLRAVMEMTWALYGGLERLADYEAKSAALFFEKPLAALCHFNRVQFTEALRRDAACRELFREGAPAAPPCDALLALSRRAALSGREARSGRPGPRTG